MNRMRILRLAVALTLFAVGGWLLRGYVTDDTYIHLRYAENLLARGEFSFNPGETAYGATSPLWIFGLALLLKLGLAPLLAIRLLGVISGLGVIWIADRILERMDFAERWKVAFLALLVSDAWFLRWTYSGMETPLATLLLVVLLWPLFSGRNRDWGVTREPLWVRYLAWGVAAGLAGLTRPELLLIAPLALPWLLWFEYYRATGGPADRWRSRPHAPLAAALSGWAVVVGPWLGYAWYAFGRLTPGTAAAKSSAVAFAPSAWIDSLIRSVAQLAAVQGPLWLVVGFLVLIVLYRNRTVHRASGAGAPLPDGPDGEERKSASGMTPLSVWSPVALMGVAATWVTVMLAGYAIKQVWIISRYVSPLAPVLLLAITVFAEWLMNGRRVGLDGRRLGRWALLAGVVLTLALNWGVTVRQVVPHARSFPAGLQECYGGTGDWLRENTPDDTVVAALDIGLLGYASERRVLDLMGLVSPEILELGREKGFGEMVRDGDWLQSGTEPPDYFVDRAEDPARWDGRTVHGVRFELLETCTIDGVGLREPQPWAVSLYRLVSTESRTSSAAGG